MGDSKPIFVGFYAQNVFVAVRREITVNDVRETEFNYRTKAAWLQRHEKLRDITIRPLTCWQ